MAQLSPLEISVMNTALANEGARRQAMQDAYSAYMGHYLHTNVATRPLVTEPGEVDDNVPINLIRPIVDVHADFLFGQMPVFELPDDIDHEDTDTRSAPEQWLDECLRLNNFQVLLMDSAKNGDLFGTPFIRFDTTRPYPASTRYPAPTGLPFPRLISKDPYTMSMKWNPYDIEDITAYVWNSGGANIHDPIVNLPVYEVEIIRRDEGTGEWVITQAFTTIKGDPWSLQERPGPITWPYQWPPMLHWKNIPSPNQAYGYPLVDDTLIQLNKALAYSMSYRQRIDRLHASPHVYTKNVSFALDIRDPVWQLPDMDSEVGIIPPKVDSSQQQATGADIYEFMLEYTSTPTVVIGRADKERITSGVAQLVRMGAAVRRAETRRVMVEPALVEMCRRLFELGGWGSDYIVNVIWPELIPSDPLTKRNIAMIDYKLGIKAEVIVQKLGYQVGDLDPNGPPQGQAQANMAQPQDGVPGAPDTSAGNPNAQMAAMGMSMNGHSNTQNMGD